MFKNTGLCLQECVTYVLDLCLKCIIRITCKLGDLLSQQFGTDCICAIDSLSQLNVLHRLHADMLIGCLTVLVCGHASCWFCLLWTGLCTHFCFRNISTEQLPLEITPF